MPLRTKITCVPQALAAIALLRRFDPGPDARATQSLARTLALLGGSPDPFSRRSFNPGHLTASGIVLSADARAILLIFHRRLERWLQPGGHVEPGDADLPAAAEREVVEETGLALDATLPRVLVGVDVHAIPPREPDEPPHLHHDVVFRFRALPGARPAPEQGREVVWCGIDRLDRYNVDGSLKRSVRRALREPMA
jgi:8-oxo-dGTP pyrophosphatase MutT (NUDIX family)